MYLETGNLVAFQILTLMEFEQAHRVLPHLSNKNALNFEVIYISLDFVWVNNSLK